MEFMIIATVFVFGLCFGSFFNVVALRLAEEKGLFSSNRSYCPHCKTTLSWKDLVPVFSFIFLRGKCRYCKTPISPLYATGELVSGVTFVILYSQFGLTLELLPHLVLGIALIVSTVSDLRKKIVLNSVVVVSLVGVLASRLVLWEGVQFYLISAAVVFAVLFAILVLSGGKLGGGDVKLFAVIGLAVGVWDAFFVLFLACIASLVFTLPLMAIKKIHSQTPIPFVPFIWAGVMLAYILEHPLLAII